MTTRTRRTVRKAIGITRADIFLAVLSVISVVALAGAVFSLYGLGAQSRDREKDRIESDLSSCARGNVFRQDVIDIATAGEELDRNMLDVVFRNVAPDRRAQVDELLRQIEVEAFDPYEEAVTQVSIVDCDAAVPGSTP